VGLGALGVVVMLCAQQGIAGALVGRIGAALFLVTRLAGPEQPPQNRSSKGLALMSRRKRGRSQVIEL
jgi:hypothetical protein